MSTYSQRLNRRPAWAVREGSRFFDGNSAVNRALHRITGKLDELQIPYAVVGGMAVFQHGYRRFTEDIDLLVRKPDLLRIHDELEGRGYLPKFQGSRNLQDTDLGVSIEFLTSGEFPGDGRPKPVAFPDPAEVAVDVRGIKCIKLQSLIELKLASALTEPSRIKDLADVVELIRLSNLDLGFEEELNVYVRPKFAELWQAVHSSRRYVRYLTGSESDAEIEAMVADGVSIEGRVAATHQPVTASRHDLHEETEFLKREE